VADDAIARLRELVGSARNLVRRLPGRDQLDYANEYVTWVEDCERYMRSVFLSSWVWEDLQRSPRFAEIRHMTYGTLRPAPLVSMEAEAQAERLEGLIRRLESEFRTFELDNDAVAVLPDTNIFIHFHRYDQIDWPKLVDSPAVRLIVLALVIDELDAKSYRSSALGDRVRGVLRSLRQLRGNSLPEVPVFVRDGVDLQVFMDPPGRRRRPNADDEFLARAEQLANILGRDSVIVATGDLGMQLRATNRGLRHSALDERLRLPLKEPDPPETAE
jgi:PIN domain